MRILFKLQKLEIECKNIKILTRVDLVSDSLKDAGEAQMTMVVLALPPNDSWRIRVNFESL